MKISLWLAPVASVVILFGSVGVATLTGDWVTSGRQQVVQGERLTVDDLKGWMTLGAAADGLGVPVDTIIALIDPPEPGSVTASTAFKDVEALVPGFELTMLREQLRVLLEDGAPATSSSAAPGSTPSPTSTPSAVHTPEPGTNSSVTGAMTLAQVAQGAGIDVADLLREAGLPEDTDTRTPLKDLRDRIPGFEVSQVRDAVARLS